MWQKPTAMLSPATSFGSRFAPTKKTHRVLEVGPEFFPGAAMIGDFFVLLARRVR